jgi:predicted NUDIX family NTP pyrophosphohydrolase
MPLRSAGVLLYRPGPEVLLVHPGGPLWARRDDGVWSIPKGLVAPGETDEVAAQREFTEETGLTLEGELLLLGEFRQPGGKRVIAFAMAGDFDPAKLVSNAFEMEWPPRSGRRQSFAEVDRAEWFSPGSALTRLLPGQRPILATLLARLEYWDISQR